MAKKAMLKILPEVKELLALQPEDLAAVILEVAPYQNARLGMQDLLAQVFLPGGGGYPNGYEKQVLRAFAEALSWLVTVGLMAHDHTVSGLYYIPTRRSESVHSRSDFDTFRTGRMLPLELLPPVLAEKVWPLFLRGDRDVAVFQAFKEVEVTVRNAANQRGAKYANDLVGTQLMRRAFDPENGPLRDPTLVPGERAAESHIFTGAIGHAKNPTSHREVEIPPPDAARLIVFASHLLMLVERRLTVLSGISYNPPDMS
jgi:hypothetical protein